MLHTQTKRCKSDKPWFDSWQRLDIYPFLQEFRQAPVPIQPAT